MIVTAFLWAITFSPAAHAADAEWDAGSLSYDSRTYQGPSTANREMATTLGIPENSEYYESVDTSQDPKVSRILYFTPGVDKKDATSAQYTEYTLDTRSADTKYTRVRGPDSIAVNQASFADNGTKEETSCVISGIGYVICPLMNYMADTMDKIFDILKSFLQVSPLSTATDSSLHKAWFIALTFANVLFIIGFLVIIYSYVTNQGVKQYDIRSIIPRLIAAAILINASYYICALAVDASNIVGSNLQDIFNTIREQVAPNDVVDKASWSQANTMILSGGTIGTVAGLYALGAYGAAAIHLLMPMLIAAVIAVLVVVIVLAARQAIITVLIILAPLAFAAFILPSTQKYFDKWKDIFMTMLLVYPMFSLLFGGSQLAATLIAQNATSVIVVLFAMFIQVAPLIITPFLIKFSGSLLGRIAGMVNNPAKGLGDRAKNWSKSQADMAKQDRMTKGSLGSGMARTLDNVKRKDEARKKRLDTLRNAQFNEGKGRRSVIDQKRADDRLATADKMNDAVYEGLKRTDADVRIDAVKLKIAEMSLESNKAKMDTYLHELESGKGKAHHVAQGDEVARTLGSSMHTLAEETMVQASRKDIADGVHKAEFASHMVQSSALKAAAGGIAGVEGELLATARATQTIRADFGKGVEASAELMKHFNLSSGQVHSLALNKSVDSNGAPIVGKDSEGNSYAFSPNVAQMFEAAIEKDMKENNFAGVREIIELSGTDAYKGVRATIKDGIVKNGLPGKAVFMGGRPIDMVGKGEITASSYHKMIAETVRKGKVDQQALITNDADALKDINNLLRGVDRQGNTINPTAGMASREERMAYGEQISVLYKTAYDTLTNPRLKDKLKPNAKAELKRIAELGGYNVSSI
ncbi:hypothetical protein I8H83_02740 [Candidatus Saccharibacteria bacterium]|nr:hypothetical protein [Candidatus Saccharibacteria bacterium]MBH2007494.1 hypothetical protein [Candidatus Saccharibacteria bacterium]